MGDMTIVERLRELGFSGNELGHEAADEIERLTAEDQDLQALFELQRQADQRAVKRWKEAHQDLDHVWPDRADMVVWLMEQHAASPDYERGRRDLAREVFALHEDTVEKYHEVAERDVPQTR
jgi:hypothetical protein